MSVDDYIKRHPVIKVIGTITGVMAFIVTAAEFLELAERRHWIASNDPITVPAEKPPTASPDEWQPTEVAPVTLNDALNDDAAAPSPAGTEPSLLPGTPPTKHADDLEQPSFVADDAKTNTTHAATVPTHNAGRECPVFPGAFSIPIDGRWYAESGFGGFRIKADRDGLYFFNPHERDPQTQALGKENPLHDPGFRWATNRGWLSVPRSPFWVCVDKAGNAFGHFGPLPPPA